MLADREPTLLYLTSLCRTKQERLERERGGALRHFLKRREEDMANFFAEISRPSEEEWKEVEGLWPKYVPRHRELLSKTEWFQKLDEAERQRLERRQSRIPGPESLYEEFFALKLLAGFADCMLKELGRIDAKRGKIADWCADGFFTATQLCSSFLADPTRE